MYKMKTAHMNYLDAKNKGLEVDLDMSEENQIINIFTDGGGSEDLTTLPDGLTFITSVS